MNWWTGSINLIMPGCLWNTGKGAKYTRGRGPLELVYTEACADKSAALKRELAIKALSRKEKEELLKK